MNKQIIAIKKLGSLILNAKKEHSEEINRPLALSLNAEMMNIGFVMSETLCSAVSELNNDQINSLANVLIPELRKLKGADVSHQPMYPNFPEQIMDAPSLELYANALAHYWSNGQWMPDYNSLFRPYAFEATKFKEISIEDEDVFKDIFTQLLRSNESLSEEDKDIIAWFILNYSQSELTYPDVIPFLENKSVVAAILLAQEKDITHLISTTTDVLRIVTYLSEGDVSLASNTKFISLPRSLRRKIIKQLERVITEEDIGRHKNKWKALMHSLHVGDYSEKVYSIASKLRNNERLESFYANLEYFLNTNDIHAAVTLLKNRPGEYARKLDHLIRLAKPVKKQRLNRLVTKSEQNPKQGYVVDEFLTVSDHVATRVLLQLLGHMNRRHLDATKRIVFPKGKTQKAVVLHQALEALDPDLLTKLTNGIRRTLIDRFSSLENLGKVWIDPELMDCPVPTQQRSTSEGLVNVARGTRLPIYSADEKDTLRFFIYWIGRDIDLSATFHYEDFSIMEQVSYTNLRSKGFQAYHSGDITSAPTGASEFIDVTVSGALERGARYLAMNVLVYSGPTFASHEECFAGWMMRENPKNNEVFEAKTVEQKIDIRANSRNVVPVVFDLKARKAIWTDISTSSRSIYGGNNVESNQASIKQTLESVIEAKHKLSLYELFELHANARGSLVESRDDADTIFSIETGITPFDIGLINSEFIS